MLSCLIMIVLYRVVMAVLMVAVGISVTLSRIFGLAPSY